MTSISTLLLLLLFTIETSDHTVTRIHGRLFVFNLLRVDLEEANVILLYRTYHSELISCLVLGCPEVSAESLFCKEISSV